jgi:hypothetical protein
MLWLYQRNDKFGRTSSDHAKQDESRPCDPRFHCLKEHFRRSSYALRETPRCGVLGRVAVNGYDAPELSSQTGYNALHIRLE